MTHGLATWMLKNCESCRSSSLCHLDPAHAAAAHRPLLPAHSPSGMAYSPTCAFAAAAEAEPILPVDASYAARAGAAAGCFCLVSSLLSLSGTYGLGPSFCRYTVTTAFCVSASSAYELCQAAAAAGVAQRQRRRRSAARRGWLLLPLPFGPWMNVMCLLSVAVKCWCTMKLSSSTFNTTPASLSSSSRSPASRRMSLSSSSCSSVYVARLAVRWLLLVPPRPLDTPRPRQAVADRSLSFGWVCCWLFCVAWRVGWVGGRCSRCWTTSASSNAELVLHRPHRRARWARGRFSRLRLTGRAASGRRGLRGGHGKSEGGS